MGKRETSAVASATICSAVNPGHCWQAGTYYAGPKQGLEGCWQIVWKESLDLSMFMFLPQMSWLA